MNEVPGTATKVGCYAVVRTQEPAVFLAENTAAMERVLALHLVSQLPSDEVSSPGRLREMRDALLQERWADALVAWIEETGTPVDVYEEAPKVWTDRDLDEDGAALEIRMSPLFSDV